jgi:hypothetical protein
LYQKRRWLTLTEARQKQLERIESLEGHRSGRRALAQLKPGKKKRRSRAKAWDSDVTNSALGSYDQHRNLYSPTLAVKQYMNKRAVMAKYGKRLPAFASLDSMVDKLVSPTIDTSDGDITQPPPPAPIITHREVNYHVTGTNASRNVKLLQLHDRNRRNARNLMRPDAQGLHVWKATAHTNRVTGNPGKFFAEVSTPVTMATASTLRAPTPKASQKQKRDMQMLASEMGIGV